MLTRRFRLGRSLSLLGNTGQRRLMLGPLCVPPASAPEYSSKILLSETTEAFSLSAMTRTVSAERVVRYFPAAVPGVSCWYAYGSDQDWLWFHETLTVCRVWSASTAAWYRGGTYSYKAGGTYVYEPGEVHRSKADAAASFAVLHIDDEYLGEFGSVRFHHASENGRHGVAVDSAVALVVGGAPLVEQESALAGLVTGVLSDLAERSIF